jgi:hypothetical protein
MRNGAPTQNAQQQQQALNQFHHLQQLNEAGSINNNQNIVGGGQNSQKTTMRDNLHYAADSVSHAMTSLVRELNTGA